MRNYRKWAVAGAVKLGLAAVALLLIFASRTAAEATRSSERAPQPQMATALSFGVIEVVTETFATDHTPYAIAFDGANIWAIHQFSETAVVRTAVT